MPSKRRTKRRSLKPHVTDDAVWVFLALEQMISDGDDQRFEPRGRRREALNAIKTLAQLTGARGFNIAHAIHAIPIRLTTCVILAKPKIGKRHGPCGWRLLSARGEPYARSNRTGEPETYRPNLARCGRGTRSYYCRVRHDRIHPFFYSLAGAVILRLAFIERAQLPIFAAALRLQD